MRTCPLCKGKISNTAKKCKHCGEWVTKSNNYTKKYEVHESHNEKKLSNNWLIIGLVVGMCILFCIFALPKIMDNNIVKDGYNTIKYDNGDIYEGNIVNEQKNGKGTYYWADGDRYEGEWKNGKRNGKGTYYLADGRRYEGEWKNDKKNGYGKFYRPDGDYYKGEWENDKRNGKGTYYWADGRIYEGEWKNDKKNGYGKFYGLNGYKYFGYRKDNLEDGEATEYLLNGEGRYEGTFKVGYRYNGIVKDKNGRKSLTIKEGLVYDNYGNYVITIYDFKKDPEKLLNK